MSTERRIYPNPPIVEAVVELRFEDDGRWSPDIHAAVMRRLPEYPGPVRVSQQIELHAAMTEEGVTTGAHTTLQAVFHPSADGTSLIGLGSGLLSVHLLAPYASWEAFIERVDVAVAIYIAEVAPRSLKQVAVRYIDRIKLPSNADNLTDYFLGIPARPAAMPAKLSGFHVALQATDDDGTIALLTLSTAESDADLRPVVLYDLNLARFLPHASGVGSWKEQVEDLHKRQREIFEGSITDKTRELFV